MKVNKIIVLFDFSHCGKPGLYSIPVKKFSDWCSSNWLLYQGDVNVSGYGSLDYYTVKREHNLPEGAQLIKSIPDHKLSYLDD